MQKRAMKRVVLIALCAVLLFIFMLDISSVNVTAAEPTTLYVGGVNAKVTPSGSGWSYNNTTGTLTLNNASITGTFNNGGAADYSIFSSGGALTIVLNNTNSITASGEYDTAIYADGGLTISGSGSLNAVVPNSTNAGVIIQGGPFTMSGTGTVTVQSEASTAISGVYGAYCDLIVTNGTLNAVTNAESTNTKTAINAKDISVSGNGKLNATTTCNAEAISCNSLTANFAAGTNGFVYARTSSTSVNKKAINATNGANIISGVITPAGASVATAKEIRIESPRIVPAAVGNLTAMGGNGTVTLSWSAPTDTGGSPITGYNVYNSSNVKQNSSLITGTTYTISALTNGTTYSYYVKAANSNGEGDSSVTVSATPNATVPAITISRAEGATGNIAVGETLFSSFAGGATPTVTYQWQYALTPDATTWNSFTTTGYRSKNFSIPKGYGDYYVRISASGTGLYSGQVYSNALGPIALAPINIGFQPKNSYILNTSSSNASFTVLASSPESAPGKELVYRWIYGDDSDVTSLEGVTGANTTTLTIAHDYIDSHSEKRFRCIISYADGSGERAITNEVRCGIGTVPQITVQPSTNEYTRVTTVQSSYPYSLTLSAAGYPFTSIQWQYTENPNDAYPSWSDITDAQGTPSSDGYFQATFRTAMNLPEGLYKFRCVVKNNYGTTTSNPTGLFSVLAPSVSPAIPSSVADSHYSVATDGLTYIRDDLTAESSSVGFPLDNSSSAYDANTVFKVYADENMYSELTNVRATFDVNTGKLILSSYPSGYLAEGAYYVTAAKSGEAQSIEATRFSITNKIHISSISGGYNNGILYKGYPDSVSVTIDFSATESTDFNAGDTWTILLDSAPGLTATPSTGSFSGAGGNRTITITFSNTTATPAGDYRFHISSDGYESISGTVTVENVSLHVHASTPNSGGVGDGDGVGIIVQNEITKYTATITATPNHTGATYQWQESSDSTNGLDGTWVDIPLATSREYSRRAAMSDSGHWFRCQITTVVVGSLRVSGVSNAVPLIVRYPVNANWLMVMNANGDMVPVTEDTILKPGDVLGFQLNAGYGYNGIVGTETSISHPGVQEICATGFGMFDISRGHRSYISYDALTSTAITTYTLTTADIGSIVRFYHQFYRAAGTPTNSLYTSYGDESFTFGSRPLNNYSDYSPIVRGDLTLVSIHNNSRTYPEVAFGDTLAANIAGTGASPTATYQWQVYDGTSWSNISGATSSRYVVGTEAVGKMIRVIATGSGSYDGTVTSTTSNPATRAITNVSINKRNPAIGDVLSATTAPSDATVTYEWKANGVTIGTGRTYIVTANEWKHTITLVVTGTGIYTGSASDTTSPVTKGLTGIAISTDAPLTGSQINTTLSPAIATATYKWYTGTSASGPFTQIAGATSSSYTPTTADRGRYIKVVATGSGEYSGVVESTPRLVKTQISSLVISSASANTATQLSVTIAPSGATATYQWYYSDGTAISGATSATFTPVVAQMNKYVYCVATATGNYEGTATSSPAGPVAGVLLGVEVSTDSPALGMQITASELPTNASVTWKWYESSSASGPWTEIEGATLNTFTPTQAQEGKYLRVVATGIGSFTGEKEHVLTNAVATPPTITVQPIDVSIDSGASASFSLTASGTSPFTYTWQVSKDMGATWTTIIGMTSSTLALTDTTFPHSGELYRCTVSNSVGSATSTSAKLLISDSTSYHWVSGQNGIFAKGSSAGLAFLSDDATSTATVEELAHVYVDGIMITEGEDYIASSGSVIITLTPSFLEELPQTTHRLTAEFSDGSTIVTGFTTRSTIPSTDDSNTYFGFLILLMIAAGGLAVAVLRKKHDSAKSR